jgi:hypothetical protein
MNVSLDPTGHELSTPEHVLLSLTCNLIIVIAETLAPNSNRLLIL